ncbi:MAG: DUF501 domain-containing protein [Actinobacteria bacterium]|nr:MAG: DUF501 domain-containing protein [Actinomycetota bacterium]
MRSSRGRSASCGNACRRPRGSTASGGRHGSSATSAPASISSSSRASRPGKGPTLGSRVVESDRAVVERQLGRPPRAFRRVAVRCPFGRPAVTEQAAYDDAGEPFPTTFWLTCPHLVAAVSRLEAAGGVERWSRAAATDSGLGASLDRANEEQRRLRPELDLGVGGARPGAGSLKCLHAHVAFALARPGYELGDRIVAELEPRWPSVCCTA